MSAVADPPSEHSLAAAILAVQIEAPTLPKEKTAQIRSERGSYEYRYTGLDTIVEKIGPLLAKHGLAWTTYPCGTREAPMLRYRLLHVATGEVEEDRMPLLLDRQSAQAMGSAITYARRYALCAVLNLVGDVDDDGAAASSESGSQRAQDPRFGVDLRDHGKGLSDDQINATFRSLDMPVSQRPWHSLASVNPKLADRLREALDAMKAAT